jgi:hypothetical protein
MLRHLTVGLILVCVASSAALACRGPFSETTIIFDEVPTSMDAPIILEVTITDMSEEVDSSSGLPFAVMNAQVERVIRGAVETDNLKIVSDLSDCSRLGLGRGIVAGSLRSDAQRGVELLAIQESKADRAIRRAREQSK